MEFKECFIIRKSSFLLVFILVISFLNSGISQAANVDDLRSVDFKNIDLNRKASSMGIFGNKVYKNSHFSFVWNDGDNRTKKWRPQGIAGIALNGKKYVAVTWYGRKEAKYENRGVRISIADVTDKKNIRYRHILLVDENGETFPGMHGGGLVYRNGNFYVADSRKGHKEIHVFPLKSLKLIPESRLEEFYNYRYLLVRSSSFDSPIKPSFISWDWERDKLLIGSFNNCEKKHKKSVCCRKDNKNKIAWISPGKRGTEIIMSPFFCKMQGAVAGKDPETGRDIIWMSTSYGRLNRSLLYTANFEYSDYDNENIKLENVRKFTYPPGLEDMHIAKTSENIWMLTEFGPHEGFLNRRAVFAVKRSKIFPKEK